MTNPVNPLSILSRAAKADLVTSPYPHLVITDALDPAVFAQLSREFPADDVILNGRPPKDTWFDYPACKVVKDDRVSPLWREFFAYHPDGQCKFPHPWPPQIPPGRTPGL